MTARRKEAFAGALNLDYPVLDALRILDHTVNPGEDTDAMLRAIVWTKGDSLADRELSALEDLGPVAQRIFNRIAAHEGEEARGLYSTEALGAYTAALWTKVRTDDVQTTVNALQQKNLIHRMGHGAPDGATPPAPSA